MPHQAKMPIAGASDRMACDDPVAEAMHVEGASAAEVMDSDQKYVMPIGIDNYEKLILTRSDGMPYWSADKSLFIKAILASGSEISLITRPRRFGKTLNLSMLKYFFDSNHAEKNRKLFDGLAICKHPLAMEHQGQYPVVSVSFKAIGGKNLEEQVAGFRTAMSELYYEHDYLLDEGSGKLSRTQKTYFEKICSEGATRVELQSSLKRLIGYVGKYFDKQVVALVDEYDNPLLSAFHGGFEEDFRQFYRNFLGQALKDNEVVYKGVLTGIAQIAGAGLFSEFNNPDISHILDDRYAQYFGFTEKEVKQLLRDVGRPEYFDEVSAWYNGYLFGEKGLVIYNPWSVLKYIHNGGKARAYWAYTSDNALLRKELLGANEYTKEKLAKLMQPGAKLLVDMGSFLRFAEVGVGKEDSLWVLLMSAGYLKAHYLGVFDGLSKLELRIPNKEIAFIYQQVFKSWLTEKLESIRRDPKSLLMQLQSGNMEVFCQELETFFLATVSSHDVRSDNVETFYHGFVLALLGLLNTTHKGILHSNQETGLGRADIIFEPRDMANDVGIVIELKRLGPSSHKGKKAVTKRQLQKAVEEGFEQITDRQYDVVLTQRGVKRIGWISLAFSGKQMAYSFTEPEILEYAAQEGLDDDSFSRPSKAKRPRLEMPDEAVTGASTKGKASGYPHLFGGASKLTDDHWYTDDEMNALLEHYLGSVDRVAVMAGIQLEQHAGATFEDNLQQLERNLAQIEAFAGVVTPTIVVPVNLGNRHWAALYIHHNDPAGDRSHPLIGYFDPLGNLMPRRLKARLKERYPGSAEKDYLESPIKLQADGYNCGPWVIEIITQLIQLGRLPSDDFDITAARSHHQNALDLSVLAPDPAAGVGGLASP